MRITDNIDIKIINRVAIIIMVGDISMEAISEFSKHLKYSQDSFDAAIFDMGGIIYLNSAMVGLLLEYCKKIKIKVVLPEKKIVSTVRNIVGLDDVMSIYSTYKDAIDSLNLVK